MDDERPSGIALRSALDSDLPLIRRWLGQVEIQRLVGSRAAAEAEVGIAFATPSALRAIVTCDCTPIGYAHAVDAALTGNERRLALPPGTWDAMLFIGEPGFRKSGHGLDALSKLCAEVFATTLALRLSALVSVRNEAAVRIYERAGFKWSRVLDDPIFGKAWLMLCERAA